MRLMLSRFTPPGVHRLALLLLLCVAPLQSRADTLQVLTTGAFKQVVQALAPDFERRTGHTVQIRNDTAGALVKRIEQGESFDVVVLTPGALQNLAQRGTVGANSIVPLAQVGIGVAVAQGQAQPALRTVDDFVHALRQATKVAYIDPKSGGSSGIYLEGLFRQLQIADMVQAKAVLVNGGLVAEKLVSGEADLAIHQISEILPVRGAQLVGPLPESIQNYTRYAGAVSSQTPRAELARAFLQSFTTPEAAKTIADKGMQH